MECIELNRLCKHMGKVRSSQASISINSCTELSKTQFFPVNIVKEYSTCDQLIPPTEKTIYYASLKPVL